MGSVVFSRGSWDVVSQTITRKGEEIEVPCKMVSYAPPQKRADGSEFFPKLGKNSFAQVVVRHANGGDPLKVKYAAKGFRVTFPDTYRKENWWDKTPTVKIPGESTDFMSMKSATEYCIKRFGEEVAQFVLRLLISTASEGI